MAERDDAQDDAQSRANRQVVEAYIKRTYARAAREAPPASEAAPAGPDAAPTLAEAYLRQAYGAPGGETGGQRTGRTA